MPDTERLRRLLQRIDGRSYKAYKDLEGPWQLGDLLLHVDHAQGDPFAAPSRIRLASHNTLPPDILASPDHRLAAEDWLLRRFRPRDQKRGSGGSGLVRVYRPGPEVCERSAVRILGPRIEVRFQVGLPASGRRILGRQAEALLLGDLLDAAKLIAPGPGLAEHVASVVHQRALRRALREHGLVAFVADGSVLPRRSGVDPSPLPDAVPFRSPDSLRTTLCGVPGMGVPAGVTLVVGGGFHGKSTLLQAIQHGHLDFIPGDGREQVVADPTVVKVRAEDGRRVEGVDISGFLGQLPGGRSTRPFSTDDASGSTSQAAAIAEALEAGSRFLLLDEDTSATNLLVRDERMRQLIARDREPITPFVERVRQLYDEHSVSTLLVIGGVGDYLAVADRVIAMTDWLPEEVTERAHSLAGPVPQAPGPLPSPLARVPLRQGLAPGRKTRARDSRALQYGDSEVELTAVEHVLDATHAATLGHVLRFAHDTLVDDRRTVGQVLDALDAMLDDEGVELLSPRRYPDGLLVRPRRFEVAAAINRLRTLRVRTF